MNRNETLAALREQIDKKHAEAIQALETVATYLTDGDSAKSGFGNDTSSSRPAGAVRSPQTSTNQTRVERVLGAIANDFKTVGQISKEVGLAEESVRAVLYSKFVKSRLVSRRHDKKVAFKTKAATQPGRSDVEVSAASLVRSLLAKYPDGLTTSRIHAEIGDEVERIGGNKAAVGAALYNGKKRGQLLHDELSGTYTLAASSNGAA